MMELEAYRRELLAHCYRMIGPPDDVEDLVQRTFLRVWRAWDRFRGPGVGAEVALPDRYERLSDHVGEAEPAVPTIRAGPPGCDPALGPVELVPMSTGSNQSPTRWLSTPPTRRFRRAAYGSR